MLPRNSHPHEKNAAHVPPPKHLRDPARHVHRTALRAELSRVVLEAFRSLTGNPRAVFKWLDDWVNVRDHRVMLEGWPAHIPRNYPSHVLGGTKAIKELLRMWYAGELRLRQVTDEEYSAMALLSSGNARRWSRTDIKKARIRNGEAVGQRRARKRGPQTKEIIDNSDEEQPQLRMRKTGENCPDLPISVAQCEMFPDLAELPHRHAKKPQLSRVKSSQFVEDSE